MMVASAALLSGLAQAAIVAKDVDYKVAGETYQGYVAYDSRFTGKLPGVLIVHQWGGLTDYEKMRARQLADLGYVAFCVDIYGKGIRPTDPAERGEYAGFYKNDRALFRRNLMAGLDQLKAQPKVDQGKLGAIGYCFGGTGVLELARAGANVKGVVSFHGGLDNPNPQDATHIRAEVMVLHGADDPFVPKKDVEAFKAEMKAAKKKFTFIEYAGAVHSFTQKEAGNDNSKGAAYNEAADKASFIQMRAFFARLFK